MKVQRYEVYSEDRDCHVYEPSETGEVCLTEDVARLEASHAELLAAANQIVNWSDYYIEGTYHPILIYIDGLRAVIATCRHRQSRGEQP